MFESTNSTNPKYYNWNKALVGYCDGASFSGTVKHAVKVPEKNDAIHFKGSYILDAVYSTLLKTDYGLNRASDIIISGISAGGLTVLLHIDGLADKIRQFSTVKPKIVGLPDAGFFLDYPSIEKEKPWTPWYKDIYQFQQAKSINEHCQKSFGENAYKCFMAEHVIHFVKTPLFLVQSLTDSWQGQNIMGFHKYNFLQQPSSVSGKEVAYMNSFRAHMLHTELGHFVQKRDTGAFLFTCWEHTSINNDNWNEIKVDGKSMNEAFTNWHEGNGGKKLYIDDSWGHNKCTDKIRTRHN